MSSIASWIVSKTSVVSTLRISGMIRIELSSASVVEVGALPASHPYRLPPMSASATCWGLRSL